MIKAENFTIKGKCFIPSVLDNKTIPNIKFSVKKYMAQNGYVSEEDCSNPFLLEENHFLSMNFVLSTSDARIPFGLKLKKKLQLIDEEEFKTKKYFLWLRTRRKDVPFQLSFLITPSKYEGISGIIVEIRSKPVILFKIAQLGTKFDYNELDYSMILASNKEFVYDIMRAFNSKIIEEPDVISDYLNEVYHTPIVDKLEKYGFNKVAKIISDGLGKLNKGEVKEALDELRSALEIFTKQITEKVSKKVYSQDKIKHNLGILKEKNYLDEKITGVLIGVYYNKVYAYISDNIHKREDELKIRDGELLYGLSETYFDYLINKIIF